jgi:SAM-dependent methyltransferase
MNDQIQTIFNSDKKYSSDAEDFYRNYWTGSGEVKKETLLRNKAIIDRFFPEGLSGRNILEIGVGGEGGLLFLLKHNNEVHGLDVSDSAINNCQRLGITVSKANLDSDIIPFQDNSLDIVFAFEVFEHFANPQHAVEEIRRVLKPGGIFISSIPSTCTYHWPRLFYAKLFELENFKEFLTINEFRVTSLQDWLIRNCYGRYHVRPDIKSWSWYLHAVKLNDNDLKGYFEAGMHFWEKRNEYGIRTSPIEAADMFRRCAEIAPENEQVKFMLAQALVYRAINNDLEEFLKLVDDIFTAAISPGRGGQAKYLAALLLIDVEANRLGFNIMQPDEFRKIKEQLAQLEISNSLLDMINREEDVNRNLATLGKPG